MPHHHYGSEYASTDPQEVKTIVSRSESTQYLVLDSKNRNFSAQGASSTTNQPWNNFRLQRPQSLMQTYATRVLVTEVRFPWYIPNITTYNNTLWISNGVGDSIQITLPPKFYSPDDIVSAINAQITASTLNGIAILSYDDNTKTYTFTAGTGNDPWGLYFANPANDNVLLQPLYESSASLCKTLGFTFFQSNGSNIGEGGYYSFSGNPTESIYTEYIDIVSSKLNYYADQKDGSSDPLTSDSLICRLYLADEISLANGNGQQFNQPFVIHRQFKTPKAIKWNKNSVIDWLDISVYDEWGQLVPLPQLSQFDNSDPPVYRSIVGGAYPNFQITLAATEN